MLAFHSMNGRTILSRFIHGKTKQRFLVQQFTVLVDHNRRISVLEFHIIEQFLKSPWRLAALETDAKLFDFRRSHIKFSPNLTAKKMSHSSRLRNMISP
jgi:hypothetical protein